MACNVQSVAMRKKRERRLRIDIYGPVLLMYRGKSIGMVESSPNGRGKIFLRLLAKGKMSSLGLMEDSSSLVSILLECPRPR
jgi:hypothetical protein